MAEFADFLVLSPYKYTVPDWQKPVYFRKSQKVPNHSTLVYTCTLYSIVMEKLEMHKKCHTPRPHLTKYLNSKNRKRNFLAKHMQGSTNL